jgi:hypothetical protein
MSSWLDGWARRAVRPSVSDPASTPSPGSAAAPTPALSRRDLIKRASVVGAAVWATPVLQTALAPAASASGPTPDPCLTTGTCPPGAPCTTDADCGSDDCNTGTGVCRASGVDGTCSANVDCLTANCASGVCDEAWPGGPCQANADCMSGICQANKTCATSPLYKPCRTAADCGSGVFCASTGLGGGICATAWPGFGTCSANSGCTSNNCNTGANPKVCRQNNAGGTCRISADCTTALCNFGAGVCAKSNAGGLCAANKDCTTNQCVGPNGAKTCAKRYSGGNCSADGDCYAGHCLATAKCGKGGAGAPCTSGNQCFSRSCSAGLCRTSSKKRGCWTTADCTSPLTCVGGDGDLVSGTCQ